MSQVAEPKSRDALYREVRRELEPSKDDFELWSDRNSQICKQLAKELWSRLPYARLNTSRQPAKLDTIIQFANASHGQLVSWYGELRAWAKSICETASEFRGEHAAATDKAKQDVVRRIQEQTITGDLFSMQPRSFVDFKFADLDPAIAGDKAERILGERCSQLAHEVFNMLARLRDSLLVGDVKWREESCCFLFGRRIAIWRAGRQTTSRENPRTEENYLNPAHTILVSDVYKNTTFDLTYLGGLHAHHLLQPTLRAVGQTIHPLPQEYRRLVESTPDWLRGLLQVVEGRLVSEGIVEWDIGAERIVDKRYIETVRACPALVLGDMVIAGWGEAEIRSEKDRRRSSLVAGERTEVSSLANQLQVAAVIVALTAVVTMSLASVGAALLVPLAVLLGLIAASIGSYAGHMKQEASGRRAWQPVVAHAFAFTCGILAIESGVFAVTVGLWPAIICSIPPALFAVASAPFSVFLKADGPRG